MRQTIFATDHSLILDKLKLKVNLKRINGVDVMIRGLILKYSS